jgi:hypothetical protein
MALIGRCKPISLRAMEAITRYYESHIALGELRAVRDAGKADSPAPSRCAAVGFRTMDPRFPGVGIRVGLDAGAGAPRQAASCR